MDGNANNNEIKMKTWEDFPDFYENEFVRKIAGNEKWTISDKNKRPIDMYALLKKGTIWGASYTRGYNPLIDLNTLIKAIPNCANNAYHLEADIDRFVVLDIEPKCPQIIKDELLKLPWIYGETSLSGKGLHLVFELPQDLWKKYPAIQNKVALKEEQGFYEILLDHMVTFTRNTIKRPENERDISEFYNIFEILAAKTKETKVIDGALTVEDIDTDSIPMFDRTIAVLSGQTYGKKLSDFFDNHSKYEFGMCGFYRRAFKRLITNEQYKGITYTEEQEAIILYTLLTEKLEHREKHDTKRNGMPWLLFLATRCILKSDANEQANNAKSNA